MDLNTALITGAGTVLCGVLVAIIFIFGFKEKTFEEALDEQRRGELLDLIRGDKARPKKQKKAGKKAKEKPEGGKGATSHEAKNEGGAESSAVAEKAVHVEFKHPEAEVVSERPPAAQLPQEESRKKRKRDRVKPILHNKEEHSPLAEEGSNLSSVNHFDETQPKDDAMIKRRLSREDVSCPSSEELMEEPEEAPQPPPLPPRAPKPEKAPKAVLLTKANGTKPGAGKVALNSAAETKTGVGKFALNTPANVTIVAPQVVAPVVAVSAPLQAALPAPVAVPVVVKDRKKKKGDLANLQQMISKESEGVTMSLLLPLVRKAELSRSEVHQLIEQLLNRETGGSHEWVEGRQDPVARLKKQLAEKEKALSEEQQGTQAVQAKLIELRTELNSERSRQIVVQRQLEEQLSSKINELQNLNTRLQLATESQKQTMTSAQQAQSQLADERKVVHKLMEEKAAAQGNVAQDLEMHIQKMSQHHQEEMTSLQTQMSGAQTQLTELQARLQETLTAKEGARAEATTAQELAKKHEADRDRLQKQLGQLEIDLRTTQEKVKGASANTMAKDGELEKAYTAQAELEKRVKALEADLQLAHKEAKDLSTQLESTLSIPTPAPDNTPDLSSRVSQLENIVQQKDSLLTKLEAENKEHKSALTQIGEELEAQREKNNELRTKNWKAMEAVSSTEKSLEAKQKECDRLARVSAGSETKATEQAAVRELLQRLFPDVSASDCKEHSEWVEKFEAAAQKWLSSELTSVSEQQQQQQQVMSSTLDDSSKYEIMLADVENQNSQLSAMVTHYKTIIEDTEGMLNKLERHVEQEETRWRQQLQLKEKELDNVAAERDSLRSELEQEPTQQQNQVEETEAALSLLQGKLQEEEEQRGSAETRAQQLQARLDELSSQVGVLEQAKEERDALALQLAKESSHSQQLAQQVRDLEAAVALRGGGQSNHMDPTKAKDQTNATTNGPSSEPSISESGSAKK